MHFVVLFPTNGSALTVSVLDGVTVNACAIGVGTVGEDVGEAGTADARYLWRD